MSVSSSSTLTLCVLAITSAVISGQTQLNNAYYDGAVCIESVRSSGNFIGVSRDMDRFCNIQFDIKMVTDAPACENELCFAFKNTDLDTNNIYLSNELFLSDRISAASKELWYIEPASSASVLNVVPGAVNIFSVVPNQSGRTLLCRQLIRAQIELQTDNRLNRITRGCQWKLQKPTKGARGFAKIAANDILIDTTDYPIISADSTETEAIEASEDTISSRFKSHNCNPLCISWTAQEFGFSPNNLQYLGIAINQKLNVNMNNNIHNNNSYIHKPTKYVIQMISTAVIMMSCCIFYDVMFHIFRNPGVSLIYDVSI